MGIMKSRLINCLAQKNQHLKKQDVNRVVEVIFDSLTHALARGHRVELRGFGVFNVKWRPACERHNPRTGKQVAVLGSYRMNFKPSKFLKLKLNRSKSK